MKQNLLALFCGIIFGLGLAISQMIDPNRVLGFLDVTGTWDPTLIFVLGGAVGVTALAFRFVLRRPNPLFATKFYIPKRHTIDRSLLTGAALFGVGWGLTGYCPGPGIASLVLFNSWSPLLFVLAFAAGSISYRMVGQGRGKQIKEQAAASTVSRERGFSAGD